MGSGEQAEKLASLDSGPEDEAGWAGAGPAQAEAAWDQEAVCARETPTLPSLTLACLASDASSLEAPFPRTLLSPSHEPQSRKALRDLLPTPGFTEEARPREGRRWGQWEGRGVALRPAGEWPGQDMALQKFH